MTEKETKIPKNLNELKKRVETEGTEWKDALAKAKEATGGKTIAAAMKEGWTVADFAELLLGDSGDGTAEEVPEQEEQMEIHSSAARHTEAPASLNTYYISPSGFRWQFTIRPGLDAKEMIALLERAQKAESWLLKRKYKPYVPFRDSGGNRANAAGQTGGNGEAPLCPKHGKPMLPSQKGEGYYCPVKIADDDGTGKPVYCKQRMK